MPLQSPSALLHASPRHRGTVPFHASASQRYAMPSQIRAKYCHCFVSLCIALALPCVAVPLRFTAVLCYAAAIPRSGLPRHGNSSLFNATAMSRFSSLCPRVSLHSLAVAILRIPYPASPLPCSVLRNFAFATHRQSNRRRSMPWLIHAYPCPGNPCCASAFHHFSMPQQFNSAQCHSKTPPCCSMPSLYCSIHSQAIAVHSYPCRSLFHDFVTESAP